MERETSTYASPIYDPFTLCQTRLEEEEEEEAGVIFLEWWIDGLMD